MSNQKYATLAECIAFEKDAFRHGDMRAAVIAAHGAGYRISDIVLDVAARMSVNASKARCDVRTWLAKPTAVLVEERKTNVKTSAKMTRKHAAAEVLTMMKAAIG